MKRIFIIVCLLIYGGSLQAQDAKMQGVFIFSFTRYVQWPEEYNQGDFIISIIGDSPMVQELQNLADKKKVDGRTIKLVKVNTIAEIKRCNILFLPDNQSNLMPGILTHINNWATLLVTQQEGLGKKGSSINFVTKDGKPTFELNMNAVTKHQLKIFTELTRHAILI